MNKKKIIIILIAIFIIMLFPIPFKLKDGGSIEYRAILYKYTKIHRLNNNSPTGYEDGWTLEILGMHVKEKIDTYETKEHIIKIKTNDKLIEANTSSFCYSNGGCIDKIDFQDFSYDVITTYYNDKLYIDNLDGTIESIDLFDYSTKEFIDKKVDFSDEFIVMPSISGPYIFRINATYEGKKINYYFMAQINENDGTDIDLTTGIKEKSISNVGLTIIFKNESKVNLEYGNPYTIEEYKDGYWITTEPIDEMAFTLPAFELKPNEEKELEINWQVGYGQLKKGKYRIVKQFSYEKDKKYMSFNKYFEFEIK